MMTLERFESLADSYGGQLWRWPEDSRSDAEALLSSSAEARRILDRARILDETIGAASVNSTRHTADAPDSAALARLRSAVAMTGSIGGVTVTKFVAAACKVSVVDETVGFKTIPLPTLRPE